jgi:hypothetical protein
LKLHPGGAGNGSGKSPRRSIEEVLAEAGRWLAENPYSEVTISRRGVIVDTERKKTTRCEVGE